MGNFILNKLYINILLSIKLIANIKLSQKTICLSTKKQIKLVMEKKLET